MFKSKEDLIKESPFYENVPNDGYKQGIKDAFSSIAERVEFYDHYRKRNWNDKIEHLWKGTRLQNEDWEDWLFHFCFDGITEKPIPREPPKCITCGTSINIHDEAYDGKCSKCRKVK